MSEERYLELEKCCGTFPLYHVRPGHVYLMCHECANMSDTYQTRIQANRGWNQYRRDQLKWGNWKLKNE